MRALFPCGSVTGAPKIRTMEIIAALEPEPRGVYTGAIGLVRPGGDAVFSVAIRTLVVDRETGEARSASAPASSPTRRPTTEYDECLLKGAFVDALPLPGAPAVVRVPPAAQRDFELIETVRVDDGRVAAPDRSPRSDGRVGAVLRLPWDRHAVEAAVRKEPAPFGLSRGRIRLLPGGRIADRGPAVRPVRSEAPRRAGPDAGRPLRPVPVPQDDAA